MAGITLIEPTSLYNLLNGSSFFSDLSEPNHILLLDAREKHEYNESHIITARKSGKDGDGSFLVPYDSDLECKEHVIVYDGRTATTTDEGAAKQCAEIMSANGSRNKVKILRGGYEEFSALYPFLRTQKVMFMPRELDNIQPYPCEIIQGVLYLGNLCQAGLPYIHKDLKIKAYVACNNEKPTLPDPNCFSFDSVDSDNCDIYCHLKDVCAFIDGHISEKRTVLVYSDRGLSRAPTVVIAYLIFYKKCPLSEAWETVKKSCKKMRPNRSFVEQLSKFEADVLGSATTDISDPNY